MRRIASHIAALVGIAGVFGSILPVRAQTAPPNAINFQARVATPAGNPIPDGTYNVTIRLYSAATGGDVLHDQNFANVQVKNGVIAVLIAGFTADKFNGNAYLGIRFDGEPEIMPRQQIVAVPYALKSNLALTVPDDSITNAKLAGGITADKLFGGTLNDTAWLLGGNVASTVRFLGTLTNAPVSFVTNSVERMRIAADGKVGIGTGAPVDSLTVVGTGTAISAIDTSVRTRIFSSSATSSGYIGTSSAHGLFLRTSDTDRIFINPTGLVGVGNTGIINVRLAASANGLQFAFGTTDRMIAIGYDLTSDARLKEHIETVPDALSTLLGLRGVSYDWNPNVPNAIANQKERQYGFLAQEVEQVLPALVRDGLNGYKAVNYMGIIPVAVEAIRAQQSQISALRRENHTLKATLDSVLKRLDAMERQRVGMRD